MPPKIPSQSRGMLTALILLILVVQSVFAQEEWQLPVDLGVCHWTGGYYQPYRKYGSENFHTGVDLGCPANTPVYASAPGVIYLVQPGWQGFARWSVFIYHGEDSNGRPVLSFYTHLNSATVEKDDFVEAGQQIGYTGTAGTGAHIHWGRSTIFPEEFYGYEQHARDNSGLGWEDPTIPPQIILKVTKEGTLGAVLERPRNGPPPQPKWNIPETTNTEMFLTERVEWNIPQHEQGEVEVGVPKSRGNNLLRLVGFVLSGLSAALSLTLLFNKRWWPLGVALGCLMVAVALFTTGGTASQVILPENNPPLESESEVAFPVIFPRFDRVRPDDEVIVFPGPIVKEVSASGKIANFFPPTVLAWDPQILGWASKFGLDPNYIATIMTLESCGWSDVVSRAGAQGIFQVMPYHFEPGENKLDVEINAYRGLTFASEILKTRDGDIGRSLAAYNGGLKGTSGSMSTWPSETRRYFQWGTGIYADARNGLEESETLKNWLAAGGQALCDGRVGR